MHKSNYLLQESADTRTNSRSDRTRREKESTDFAWEGNGLPRIRFPRNQRRERNDGVGFESFGMACRSSGDCYCSCELVRYSFTSHQLAQGEPTQVGVSSSFSSSFLLQMSKSKRRNKIINVFQRVRCGRKVALVHFYMQIGG